MSLYTDRQNILFIVADSARLRELTRHGENFQSISSNNLSFANAITPADWSLPSHASLFTGQYPQNHGIYAVSDKFENVPLVKELDMYNTYAVSANGYASSRTGFFDDFDDAYFTKTKEIYPEGLSISNTIAELTKQHESKRKILASIFTESIGHKKPSKSLANLLYYIYKMQTTGQHDDYKYAPTTNTKRIENIISKESKTNSPTFIFSNYMDCHRPYKPPKEILNRLFETIPEESEIKRLNQTIAKQWDFINEVERGHNISEQDIKNIRKLYIGEVISLDKHIQKLFDILERYNMKNNTLVVITADHGEVLGEEDELGNQRMGHAGSISNNLLNVPLVIAHPQLNSHTVTEYVSTKNLYDFFISGYKKVLASSGNNIECFKPSSGVVLSTLPANRNVELYNRYPDIKSTLKKYVSNHTVIGYMEHYKYMVHSDGSELLWESGNEKQTDSAPDVLKSITKNALEEFETTKKTKELSKDDIENLEALGYL